jgi:hypothetical protein
MFEERIDIEFERERYDIEMGEQMEKYYREKEEKINRERDENIICNFLNITFDLKIICKNYYVTCNKKSFFKGEYIKNSVILLENNENIYVVVYYYKKNELLMTGTDEKLNILSNKQKIDLLTTAINNQNLKINDDDSFTIHFINKKYKINCRTSFNEEFILTKNMTYLSFDDCLNKKLEKMTHLTFDYFVNKKLKLTKNATYLSLGKCFNQEIECCENMELDNNGTVIKYLTNKVKNLILKNYERRIENLPNSIRTIKLISNKKSAIKKPNINIKFV